jgi:hypothetical protein
MACLVNPGEEGSVWGKRAVAFSSVVLGRKNLQALTLTETLFGRLGLGYGVDRLGLGTLPDDIDDATIVLRPARAAWPYCPRTGLWWLEVKCEF